MTSGGGNSCAVDGCRSNNKRNSTLSFFSLPADEKRRKKWAELIGRPNLATAQTKIKSYSVCSLHFEPSVITYIPKLQRDALPTKLLPSQTTSSNSNIDSSQKNREEKSTQTKHSTVSMISACTIENADKKSSSVQTLGAMSCNTPRKRRLSAELNESNRKKRKVQYELDKIEQKVQSTESQELERFSCDSEDDAVNRLNRLVKWQSRLKNKSKGNRYAPEFKLFALNLHFSSPHTYRTLKTFLSLPSESTLLTFKMVIPPKFEDRTLEFLTAKLKSLPKNAKYCTLCLDEMVLKRHLHYDTKRDEIIGLHNINGEVSPEIASHAYVLMLRGIIVNWKQPLAYSFLASPKHYERLEHWLDEVILELFNIGVEVKAIVSDQGSSFDKYAKQVKQVTKEKPYFLINEKKIYYIFDVPHLIKCLRNNLLTNDFEYDGKKISWKYIDLLYSKQQESNLKLIPKITDAHIKPNNFQKMKVKYAAQIFSHSVYLALNVLIYGKNIPQDAKETADFVEKINNLFDVLNSSSVKGANKYQTAFSFKKYQLDVLKDAAITFQNLKAIDSTKGVNNTNRIKSFKNLQITMQSLIMLCKDMKEEGFNYIFTRRLNQDCLKNFFDTVRQQCGNYHDPSPIQFKRAFAKLFLSNMLKSSPNSNCEEDISELLQKDPAFLERPMPRDPAHRFVPSSVALNGETDYRFDLPTENALEYISSYLLYKCNQKHTCPGFVSELNKIPDLSESRMFAHFESFNKSSSFYGRLRVPSNAFCNYVRELEVTFLKNFENILAQKPGGNIFEHLKKVNFTPPCFCFPHEYLLRLYVRFRIFSTIQFNNREFRASKKIENHYIQIKLL